MADPYALPAAGRSPSRVSLIFVVGFLVAILMGWQVISVAERTHDMYGVLSVEAGESIEYDYTARLPNGTLWATTVRAVAERANAEQGFPLEAPFSYAPRTALIDPENPGLGWGPDAERDVAGAFVGSTVRFTVRGEHGTGAWEPFNAEQGGLPRELAPQRFIRTVFLQEPAAASAEGNVGTPGFNLTDLDAAIGPLSDGSLYNANRSFPPSWDIHIDDISHANRSLLFTHTVEDGQFFDVPELPGGVSVLLPEDETLLVYRFDLRTGGTFVVAPGTPLNSLGLSPGSYRVDAVNATHLGLSYHPSTDPATIGLPLSIELTILRKV